MAAGSDKGLRLLDQLAEKAELNDYYLFHAARADLLRRTGRLSEARLAYARALELCQNVTEQTFLHRRLTELQILPP